MRDFTTVFRFVLHFIVISACYRNVYATSTAAVVNSFIDPNVVLQESFEGWGTSLCWWADMVGGMEQDILEHVVDALFSPSKLNLNILRYVIGGTTPNNYTCGEYRDGAATESFKDGFDSPYNWNRDLRQRKVMEMAKAKGADVFEAFSNSPPQWLTISGCSKGNSKNPPLHSNFDASNSELFADYATEVIKYFHEKLNITFSTYSPFNEPFGLRGIGGWAGDQSSQEGCNLDRPTMVSVIKSVNQAVAAKNLSFLKIAVSDETQVNTQIQSYDYFVDAGVSDMFSQVNVHGYWDQIELSRKDLLSLKCSKGGQDLWMDEMGWGGTPSDNMEQGLNIASRIVLDLRKMLPSAWVYWQVVEDAGGWGLLDVPYRNTSLSNIRYNSGYYAMQQFSQHIKRGSKLVYISDENSIAALNAIDETLMIVTINPDTSEVTHEFDFRLLDSMGSLELFRTSSNEQHLTLPPPAMNAENKVEIVSPPYSISTLVVSGVKIPSGNNKVVNGNFEEIETVNGTISPKAWTLQAGNNDGVTEDNAWRGSFSGVLNIGLNKHTSLIQDVSLSQKLDTRSSLAVAAAAPCSLYLSAWCSSTQPGTKLGVKINETILTEVEISRNGAYSSYGVSFSANAGETLQVYFTNNGTLLNGSAKIDNVILHMKCSE